MKTKLLKKIRARFKYAFLAPDHFARKRGVIHPMHSKGVFRWIDKKTGGEGDHHVHMSGCDYYCNGTRITQPSFAEAMVIAILGIYPVAKHRRLLLKRKIKQLNA